MGAVCRRKIYIRDWKLHFKNIPSLVIYFEIVFVMLYRALISMGAPASVSYILDICNCFLLLNIIKSRLQSKAESLFGVVCILWGIVGTISTICYNFNPFSLLWSYRNNFRFIIFFYACVKYLDKDDIQYILDGFSKLMHLEFLLIIVQYFMGYRADYLGGIFGTTIGANLYVNVYMVIVFCYLLCKVMNRKEQVRKLVIALIEMVMIAVMSELKFIFVEIVICFLIYMLISKKNTSNMIKYIVLGILGYIIIINALPIIYRLYPDFENFFSIEFIFAVHKHGYSMSGDLDRLSAIPTIYDMFFKGDLFHSLFGIGLGSAEYSSISFLSSAFYDIYGYLHYTWFSSAMIYLETGAVGLILYCTMYIYIFVLAWKNEKNKKSVLMECSMLVNAMCFIWMIYNQTLRTEAAYLIFMIFALPFIYRKKNELL